MRVLLPILLLALAAAGIPHSTVAQDYRGGAFGFQAISPYPTVHALGEATVAADGALGFADVNPATIGEAGALTLGTPLSTGGSGLFASEWFPEFGEDLSFATPVVTARMGRWAGALHLKRFNSVRQIEVPTLDGAFSRKLTAGPSILNVDALEYRVGGTVAYQVSRPVRLGVGLNYVRVDAGDRPATATVNVDVGIHAAWSAEAGMARLRPTLGASLVGWGPTVTDETFGMGQQGQATTFRVGAGLQARGAAEWAPGLPILQGALYTGLTKELAGGTRRLSGDEPFGPFEALVQTWGAADGVVGPGNEPVTASAWDQITRHVGLSATLFDVVSLRTGRRFASDKAVLRPSFTAVGIGLDLDYVRLDYAATVSDDGPAADQSYLRITARIPLTGMSSPLWTRLLQ